MNRKNNTDMVDIKKEQATHNFMIDCSFFEFICKISLVKESYIGKEVIGDGV